MAYNVATVVHLSRLRQYDVGRKVKYQPTHIDSDAEPRVGMLTSWDNLHVFVQFDGGEPVACNPHFLKFAKSSKAVGGRGKKTQ